MTIVWPLGLWLVTLDAVFHGFSHTDSTYVFTPACLVGGLYVTGVCQLSLLCCEIGV